MVMNESMMILGLIISFLVCILIFAAMFFAVRFIWPRLKNSSEIKASKFLYLEEYLPVEEAHTLKQVFYLIMIIIFVFIILYSIFGWQSGRHVIIAMDIIFSVYLAYEMDKKDLKRKFLFFFLIPFGSLFIVIGGDPTGSMVFYVLALLHCLSYLYMIKVYYQKFLEYTQTNGLGITIMLLYLIVLFSFLFTIIVENVSPLDSIVMVSNAFTSNGYSVLGSSGIGKMDALFLVWSGFILSGVGSATLAVSIVRRNLYKRFDHIEDLIKKNKKN